MNEKLVSTMESMAEVFNDHDLDGALSFFADDAVVRLYPGIPNGKSVFEGKSEIREWLDYIFSNGFHISNLCNCHVDGDSMSWEQDFHLDPFAELGLDTVHARVNIVLRDERISSFDGRLADESMSKLEEAYSARGEP